MLVFTYCTMDGPRLTDMVGPVKYVTAAILPKHRIVFEGGPAPEDVGATLVPSSTEADAAIGFVFRMSCHQMHLLDAHQYVHERLHHRVKVVVTDPCGRQWRVYTYTRSVIHPEADMAAAAAADAPSPTPEYYAEHSLLLKQAFFIYCHARGDNMQGGPFGNVRFFPGEKRKKKKRKNRCGDCPVAVVGDE